MNIVIEHTSPERRLLDHLSELGMLETACILGTGANGEAGWPFIPLESYLIGVNGAVEIPLPWPLSLQARMVFDTSTPRLSWYEAYYKESSAVTILGDGLPSDVCDYRFVARPGAIPDDGLVCDCTVGGAALDLCRRCYMEIGIPHTVYLCGLDFGGGYYFKRGPDGKRYRCQAPGTWGQLQPMNNLIADCIQRGMRVVTLSETELEVEHA